MLYDCSLQSELNKMTASNLAIVFGPTVLRYASMDTDAMSCHSSVDRSDSETVELSFSAQSHVNECVEFLIAHTPEIFEIKKPTSRQEKQRESQKKEVVSGWSRVPSKPSSHSASKIVVGQRNDLIEANGKEAT